LNKLLEIYTLEVIPGKYRGNMRSRYNFASIFLKIKANIDRFRMREMTISSWQEAIGKFELRMGRRE